LFAEDAVLPKGEPLLLKKLVVGLPGTAKPVSLLVASAGPALAVDFHKVTGPATGQPNQSIRTDATGFAVPGNATSFAKSKGSPFGNTASSANNYAGAKPLPNGNSKNPKAVSQYDVAGFQQSHK
jgi:hypothetical protein